jgi:hypothetical protein
VKGGRNIYRVHLLPQNHNLVHETERFEVLAGLETSLWRVTAGALHLAVVPTTEHSFNLHFTETTEQVAQFNVFVLWIMTSFDWWEGS